MICLKYYAVISQKEILFYSSNLKNELCAIWYVNNAVISIPSKIAINKIIYYPIKIIYKNDIMNLLFSMIKMHKLNLEIILK